MTKIRKQKKKKTFKYGVNRKKLRKKAFRHPKIKCKQISEAWESSKTMQKNLEEMGLTHDPNKTVQPIINSTIRKKADIIDTQFTDKSSVAMELEEDAKMPRVKKFRLPNSQVYWLSKLIDKYDEDYKAMARDLKLNYFQETWRQIRAKIKRFKNIPEQYGEYLAKKQAETAQAVA